MIFSSTPPDVARAQINAWQRTRELKFTNALTDLIAAHERRGLEKKRLVRVIEVAAKALGKLGGA
jgi:hypothetical protein